MSRLFLTLVASVLTSILGRPSDTALGLGFRMWGLQVRTEGVGIGV